jgi:hypothetical protein
MSAASPSGTGLSGGAHCQLEVPLRGASHQLSVQLTAPFFFCSGHELTRGAKAP